MNFKNIDTLKKSVETEKQELSEIEEIIQRIEESWQSYAYIQSQARYLWIEQRLMFSHSETAQNLIISPKQLTELRKYYIPEYIWFVYRYGWKKGYFNLMDEEKILTPSNNPVLHRDIETLIYNVCWWKDENIQHLHKALLYKFQNINSYSMPAIIFYWKWGSGKGSYISLLSTIFWEENILRDLSKADLMREFHVFKHKLAVEFSEISSNNSQADIKIINYLKNIIWAEKILINEKHQKQVFLENPVWWFISSNNMTPLKLDSSHTWNRRFSVIYSWLKLENGVWINKTIRNKEIVSDYLAWLIKTYPDVALKKTFVALENEDKKILEWQTQCEVNQYWEWLEENYPNFTWRKTLREIYEMLENYCTEYDLFSSDLKKYFWTNSKFPKKKMRFPQLNGRVWWGVEIPIKSDVNTSTKSTDIPTDVSNVDR